MIVVLGCSRGSGSAGSSKEANGWIAEAYTGGTVNNDFEKIYQPVIEELKSEYEHIRAYYALFDVGNNGVPELLVKI